MPVYFGQEAPSVLVRLNFFLFYLFIYVFLGRGVENHAFFLNVDPCFFSLSRQLLCGDHVDRDEISWIIVETIFTDSCH